MTYCYWCKKDCDNPYDIHNMPGNWAQHEYRNGRGSLLELVDFARRFGLATAINRSEAIPFAVKEAIHFLLKTEGEL